MKKALLLMVAITCAFLFLAAICPSGAHSSDVNLALGKKATQSSTGYGGDPQRAVDGNTDGNYSANSVTHSNNSPQEWWQVDLGAIQNIGKIRIWNRTDCCGQRLSKFYVIVSDQPFRSGKLNDVINQPGTRNVYHEGVGGSPTEISINQPGRYVRIQLAGADYLSLAEVEVMGGSGAVRSPKIGISNLALRKKATQSSTGYGGDPQRAADGNTDGNYSANSVTHTNNSPQEWWQVDLGAVRDIGKIQIWNRTDCCGERLSRFYVLVSEAPFFSDDLQLVMDQPGVKKYYHEGVGGRPTVIPVNQSGRFVRIQLSGTDYLSLAEVEVYAAE